MKRIKTESVRFRTELLLKEKLTLLARLEMRSRGGMLCLLIEEAYQRLPIDVKAEFEKGLCDE